MAKVHASRTFQKRRKSQGGMATLEALPILVLFLTLFGYGLGLFGVVHTSILNSIAARAYAFETFRNRVNLDYFRDRSAPGATGGQVLYSNIGNRVHAIRDEKSAISAPDDAQVTVSVRPLAIGRSVASANATQSDHNKKIFDIEARNREGGVEVSPVWIMVGYGICLDATCGD